MRSKPFYLEASMSYTVKRLREKRENQHESAEGCAAEKMTNIVSGKWLSVNRKASSLMKRLMIDILQPKEYAGKAVKTAAKVTNAVIRVLAGSAGGILLPAALLALSVMLLLPAAGFGMTQSPTTFGGLFSMPFEYTDIGVNDEFGMRLHPVYETQMLHTGIDFATPHYCDILAAQTGTVILSEENGGFGNCVILEHDLNGVTMYTLYAHLSEILVKRGDFVVMGQMIGKEGGSDYDPGHGTSTGHHLHFEIRDENFTPLNPRPYLNYF